MKSHGIHLFVKIRNWVSTSRYNFLVEKVNVHLKAPCYLPLNYNIPNNQNKTNKQLPVYTLPKELLVRYQCFELQLLMFLTTIVIYL